MRKRVAILLLTAVLLFSVLSVAAVSVGKTEEQLSYQIGNERGDRSFSYGLTVSQWYSYASQVYWFADHTFGTESVTDTRFEFHTTYYEPDIGDDGFERNTVQMATVSDGNMVDFEYLIKVDGECTGLLKAYKELYDATAKGEVTNTYIRYADYCEYYPLEGYFAVPAGVWPFWNSYEANPVSKEMSEAFCEYFRIPVLGDDWIRMAVDKRPSTATMSSIDMTDPRKGADWYEMGSVGVYLNGTVYFAINAYTNAGNLVDTSLIPGGYGLYAFSYDENGYIDVDSLATVMGLDARHRPVEMIADTVNGYLLYITDLDGDQYLSVIDPKAGVLVQQIKILEKSDDWMWYRFQGDLLYCVADGEKIEVLERDGQGQYAKVFETPLAPSEELLAGSDLYDSAFAFDGERLAVVSALWIEEEGPRWESNRACGYTFSVYTSEGLAYTAQLTSTLESAAITPAERCRVYHTTASWNS